MNIDFTSIVSKLGDEAIAKVGEQVGLDRELSVRAAKALAENFHGDRKEAIAAASAETGIGQEVLQAMFQKLCDTGADMAIDHVKEQGMSAAKNMFGKFFGR
jgi:hypothetical protein